MNNLEIIKRKAVQNFSEKDLDENLINAVEELLNNKDKINKMRNNLSMMSITNSASKIYDLICEIMSGWSNGCHKWNKKKENPERGGPGILALAFIT